MILKNGNNKHLIYKTHKKNMVRNIAFIIPHNISYVGGGLNVMIQYCNYISDDYNVTIFQTDLPKGDGKYSMEDFCNKSVKIITIKRYDIKFAFLARNKFRIILIFIIRPILFNILKISEYRKLRKLLTTFDIIYLFDNNYGTIIPKGPIVIGSTHNWAFEKSGFLKSIYTVLVGKNIIWRRINYFHLFNHFCWFLEKFPNRKGFCLDNGVDTAVFRAKIIKSNNNVKFVFLARMEECKGIKRLIQAYNILKRENNDIELHVIGVGSLSGWVSKQSDIIYHGYKDTNEVAEILAKSDCLVYPTSCDTFALVVLEALASGLYVITSSHLRGVYDDFERIGMLEYIDTDPIMIAERMKNFLNMKIPKEKILEAQSLINEKYSWNSIVKNLYVNFSKIIEYQNQKEK